MKKIMMLLLSLACANTFAGCRYSDTQSQDDAYSDEVTSADREETGLKLVKALDKTT